MHWFGHPRGEIARIYGLLAVLLADGSLALPIAARYPLMHVCEALLHAARVDGCGMARLRKLFRVSHATLEGVAAGVGERSHASFGSLVEDREHGRLVSPRFAPDVY